MANVTIQWDGTLKDTYTVSRLVAKDIQKLAKDGADQFDAEEEARLQAQDENSLDKAASNPSGTGAGAAATPGSAGQPAGGSQGGKSSGSSGSGGSGGGTSGTSS